MNPAVAAVTLFALIVTKVVDFARTAFDPGQRAPKWLWIVAGLGLGEALAFIWNLNALEAISHTPAQGAAGVFLTGLGIGAASSGWHEILDAFSSTAKARRRAR